MGLTTRLAPSISITGLGTVRGARLVSATQTLCPDADAIVVELPLGAVAALNGGASGNQAPAWPPTLRGLLTVSAGSWSMSARILRVEESWRGATGLYRVTAMGAAVLLDRCSPTRLASSGGAAILRPFNPGGRGNREASAGGPSGTYRFGGSGVWTIRQAIEALGAAAVAAGDLGSFSLSGSAAVLDERASGDVRGLSFLAAIGMLLGHRAAPWRATWSGDGTGVAVTAHNPASSATDIDLRDFAEVDYAIDGSATVAACEVLGAPRLYVATGLIYPGGGADLGVVDEYNTRRCRLSVAGLPAAGRFVGGLPYLSSGAGTLTDWGGSQAWKAFILDGAAWADAQDPPVPAQWRAVNAGVTVEGDDIVLVSGIDAARWAAMDRLAITFCWQSIDPITHRLTGGAGLGTARRDVSALRRDILGAYDGATGDGTILSITAADGPLGSSLGAIIDSEWDTIRQDRGTCSFVLPGVASTLYPPGTRVGALTLPGPTARTFAPAQCMVVSRTVSAPAGRIQTTWQTGLPPPRLRTT